MNLLRLLTVSSRPPPVTPKKAARMPAILGEKSVFVLNLFLPQLDDDINSAQPKSWVMRAS